MAIVRTWDVAEVRDGHSRGFADGSTKVAGLLQLIALGLPVPEALLLDDEEFEHHRRHAQLSPATLAAIDAFVAALDQRGAVPLAALRCETKSADRSTRAPHTLLAVGGALDGLADRLSPAARAALVAAFAERSAGHAPTPPGRDLAQALRRWLGRVYERLESSGAASRAVIVQRMVLGCRDERSGSGICCGLPGPREPERRFRGVFMPGQAGMSLGDGGWGDVEVPLDDLRRTQPKVYFQLRGMFDYLEHVYGPDRYLEFCVESDELYLLQHLTRRRLVLARGESHA